MNKQYRHKTTKELVEYDSYHMCYRHLHNRLNLIHIPKEWIESSSDWEEIISKDYEILSLNIHDTRISSMVGCGIEYIKSLLNDRLTKIHSIKRLSDGEIFTIGDKVNLGYSPDKIVTIKSFQAEKNSCYIQYNESQPFQIFRGIHLISKAKQPLFTTEDGIEIFDKNHKLFEVILNNFHLHVNIPSIACNNHLDIRNDGFPSKVFSTKEAAEEYIIMNKPCLSLNDIEKYKFVKYEELDFYYNWINKLKELVKTKLNK